jgi:basic membrane protein A
MPRLLALALFGILVFGACAPQPKDCARPEVFCAGLVTDFGPVDSGINRDAWLGLQDAKTAHLVDRIDYIQTVDARDRAANIKAFAADGYDVIVTVGASISDETMTAAAKYPKQLFIGVEQPQDKLLPNLAGLTFREDFSGFLAGALAGRMTQTGHVAAVCEAEFIDPVRRYCAGFEAGARYVQPAIHVSVTYREGSSEDLFNDPEWGRTTTLQQVHEGADVLFATGGRTADAALQAAALQGIDVIGSETDLYLDLPDIRHALLSSAMSNIRSGVVQVLTLTRRGKFPSGEFMGTVRLAPWHEFDRQISLAVKQELDRIYVRLALDVIHLDIPYKQP